jgi:hypothetical protein
MSEIELATAPGPPTPAPRRRGWFVAAVVVVALAGATLGATWFVGSRGVALALSFTAGESTTYRMTMSVQGELRAAGQSLPYDLTMTGMVALRVVSVQDDGVAEVQEVFSDVTMTSDGEPVDLPAHLPSPVLHITTDGRVVSSTGATLFGGGGTQGPTQIGQDGLSAVLPTEAVRPGDAWRTPVTQTILGTPVAYTARGRYLRDEPAGGIEAAVVHTAAVVPIDLTVSAADVAELMGMPADQLPPDASFTYAGRQQVSRTSWIDADASALLKTTSRGDYTMTMSASGLPAGSLPPGGVSMRGTVTMSLERS